MFYLIIEKHAFKSIKEINGELINSSLISSDFIFVFSNIDSFSIKKYLLEKKLKAIAIMPYLSEENFNKTYSKELIRIFNLKTTKLKEPLFEILIADSLNLSPILNSEYYLLSDLMNNEVEYNTIIDNLNNFLSTHNLLLNNKTVKSSLKELLSISIQTDLINNINNENFYSDVVDRFIKKAILSYSLREIEEYLKTEFEIN